MNELYNLYDDMLDDIYGNFLCFPASQILKEIDPTQYYCGFNDYIDTLYQDDQLTSDQNEMLGL